MGIVLFVVGYIIIGFASAFFIRCVGDWFIEDFDGSTVAMVVVMWPMFWIFFIIKALFSPLIWICEMIFD